MIGWHGEPVGTPRRPLAPLLPSAASGSACGSVRGGLTDEEVDIARQIRALREEERELRRTAATASPAGREQAAARLAALRSAGRELTRLRDAARHRRMVLLGHEPP